MIRGIIITWSCWTVEVVDAIHWVCTGALSLRGEPSVTLKSADSDYIIDEECVREYEKTGHEMSEI